MSITKLRAAKSYEISPVTACNAVELDGRYYTYFRSYSGNVYSMEMVRTITYLDGSTRVFERGLSRRVTSKRIIAALNALTADKPAAYNTVSPFAL